MNEEEEVVAAAAAAVAVKVVVVAVAVAVVAVAAVACVVTVEWRMVHVQSGSFAWCGVACGLIAFSHLLAYSSSGKGC